MNEMNVGTGKSTLVNMGNTCFMNSALQCVLHTNPIKNYFQQPEISSNHSANAESLAVDFVRQFGRLIRGFWEEDCQVQPVSFYKTFTNCVMRFKDGRQHDSQECLLHILDFLHMGLAKSVKIPDSLDEDLPHRTWCDFLKTNQHSFIIDLFYGMTRTVTQCLNCNNLSKKYDPFCFLSLCFPPLSSPSMNNGRISLEDMLKFHSIGEKMTGDNRYNCEKCRDNFEKDPSNVGQKFPMCDANKMIQMWMLPSILIVGFRRYDHQYNKINTLVQCPLELDFSPYLPPQITNHPVNHKYELYAAIYHTGQLGGGHYVAACKMPEGTWRHFDDNESRSLPESEVVNSLVYVALYKKKQPSRNVEKLW